MSHGHVESEILDYSPEKILLYATLAQKRLRREMARDGLSLIRMIRGAVAVCVSGANNAAYDEMEKQLMDELELKPDSPKSEQRKGLAILQGRLGTKKAK